MFMYINKISPPDAHSLNFDLRSTSDLLLESILCEKGLCLTECSFKTFIMLVNETSHNVLESLFIIIHDKTFDFYPEDQNKIKKFGFQMFVCLFIVHFLLVEMI